MQVTNVKLMPSKKEGAAKAFGQVELAGVLAIDVRVFEKDGTPFMTFGSNYKRMVDDRDNPGQKVEKWFSPVYVKDKTLHKAIQDAVVAEYNSSIAQSGATPTLESTSPSPSADVPF